MKLVIISDTHMQMSKVDLPEGDVLIHAGDHSYRGTVSEMSKAFKDLAKKGKKFKHIIAICGNHDWLGEDSPDIMRQIAKLNNITYLQDSSVTIDGKLFWGSAWQPEFCDWAFNLPRGEKLKEKWDLIPDNANVVITHGPVSCILDTCPDGFKAGCEDLFNRIMQIKPELHICGHIHHSYGQMYFNGVKFVNASTCDERYNPVNPPIIIDL